MAIQAEREALSAALSETEDWLYGDGEDETKSVYVAKLAELRGRGGPIEERAADDASRPGAWLQQLQHARTVVIVSAPPPPVVQPPQTPTLFFGRLCFTPLSKRPPSPSPTHTYTLPSCCGGVAPQC